MRRKGKFLFKKFDCTPDIRADVEEEMELLSGVTHVPTKWGYRYTLGSSSAVQSTIIALSNVCKTYNIPNSKKFTVYEEVFENEGEYPTIIQHDIWTGHETSEPYRKPITDFNLIMTCAIRYAFGRMTYMPSVVSDYVKCHWWDKEIICCQDLMVRTLEDEINFYQDLNRGDDILNQDLWISLRDWCKKEIETEKQLKENYGKVR